MFSHIPVSSEGCTLGYIPGGACPATQGTAALEISDHYPVTVTLDFGTPTTDDADEAEESSSTKLTNTLLFHVLASPLFLLFVVSL